jgi:uncharacterized protein (TIGR03437 family)
LAEPFTVATTGPGVFIHPQSQRAIVLNQDNSVNAPENAEARGRVLTVFMTGIGAVSPEIATGEAAGFAGLHSATAVGAATIDGVPAPLLFLGLTPGFIGLAQANVMIPEGAAAGPASTLTLRVGDRAASTTTVSVR